MREDYRVVLVRRGRFRRQAAGAPAEVDPTVAYLGVPGEEERFAHPAAGGDECTSISLTPALWRVVAGEDARPARQSVYVDARLDLAHRRVLASAHTGDVDHAVTEELLGLLSAGCRPGRRRCHTVRRPSRQGRGDARRRGPARDRRGPPRLRGAAAARGAPRRLAVPSEPLLHPRAGSLPDPLSQPGSCRPGPRPSGRGRGQPRHPRRRPGLLRPGPPLPDHAPIPRPHTNGTAAAPRPRIALRSRRSAPDTSYRRPSGR